MPVACPQCGAPVEALTETSFYRCLFCSSAFVLQGDQGVQQYVVPHRRDDRIAWSALADCLEQHGTDGAIDHDTVEFMVLPFWCITLDTGAERLIPAHADPMPELAGMTLPGGDLRYPVAGDTLAEPAVPLTAALRHVAAAAVRKRSLVHLPLYLVTYRSRETPFRAIVSGADRKVCTLALPSSGDAMIPSGHVMMTGMYLVVLIIEALALQRLEWRALAFILTGLTAYAVFHMLLRSEV